MAVPLKTPWTADEGGRKPDSRAPVAVEATARGRQTFSLGTLRPYSEGGSCAEDELLWKAERSSLVVRGGLSALRLLIYQNLREDMEMI